MIHTVFSNSYEVLKALFVSNLQRELEAEKTRAELSGDPQAVFAAVLKKAQVIAGNQGIQEDLERYIAEELSIQSSVSFSSLSEWLQRSMGGVWAKAPGNEADWLIWDILTNSEGENAFVNRFPILGQYLKQKSDVEIFEFSLRISALFLQYITHRMDWVLYWLKSTMDTHEAVRNKFKVIDSYLKGWEFKKPIFEDKPEDPAYEHYAWQKALWMEMLSHGHEWIALRAFQGYLARMSGVFQEPLTPGLDHNLHFFVPHSLPPHMFPIIQAMMGKAPHSGEAASTPDVWFYVFNPSSSCWFDWAYVNTDNEADQREAQLLNPLLHNNGWSTRAMIDRLWRYTFDGSNTTPTGPRSFVQDIDSEWQGDPERLAQSDYLRKAPLPTFRPDKLEAEYAAPLLDFYEEVETPTTLLEAVHKAVLDDTVELHLASVPEDDDSITLMEAPDVTIEVEGIVNTILTLIHEKKVPCDKILVVTPDFGAKASLVDKVMRSLPRENQFPYVKVGLTLAQDDEASQALLGLFRLILTRAPFEAFFDWLALPIVQRKWAFDTQDVQTIGAWLKSAGYRYGISDAQLADLAPEVYGDAAKVDVDTDMCLMRALERLILGLMKPESSSVPTETILGKLGTESRATYMSVVDRPDLLNKLSALVSAIETFRQSVVHAALSNEGWEAFLNEALATFLPKEGEETNLKALRDVIKAVCHPATFVNDEQAGTVVSRPVGFNVIARAIDKDLTTTGHSQTRRDAVTFADMSQFRSVAFEAVLVFGLDIDSRFPGTRTQEEFDLIAAAPRRGDRDRRHDNRNLFLDMVLSANRYLVLSYNGGAKTPKDPPSIVLDEFRDWLKDQLGHEPPGIKLPLSPFNKAYFENGTLGMAQSHDPEHFAIYQDYVDQKLKPFVFLEGAGANFPTHGPLALSKLALFSYKPAKEILKADRLFVDGASADEEHPLMARSTLAKYHQREVYLAMKRLGSEEAKADMKARWLTDPEVGAKFTRELSLNLMSEAVEPLFGPLEAEIRAGQWERVTDKLSADFLWDYHDLKEALEDPSKAPAMVLPSTDPAEFYTLEHYPQYLYRNPNGEYRVFLFGDRVELAALETLLATVVYEQPIALVGFDTKLSAGVGKSGLEVAVARAILSQFLNEYHEASVSWAKQTSVGERYANEEEAFLLRGKSIASLKAVKWMKEILELNKNSSWEVKHWE